MYGEGHDEEDSRFLLRRQISEDAMQERRQEQINKLADEYRNYEIIAGFTGLVVVGSILGSSWVGTSLIEHSFYDEVCLVAATVGTVYLVFRRMVHQLREKNADLTKNIMRITRETLADLKSNVEYGKYNVYAREGGGMYTTLALAKAGKITPAICQQHTLPGTAYFLSQSQYHTIAPLPHIIKEAKQKPHFKKGPCKERPTISLVLKSASKAGYAEFINTDPESMMPDDPLHGEDKRQVLQDIVDALGTLTKVGKALSPIPLRQPRRLKGAEEYACVSKEVLGDLNRYLDTIREREYNDIGGLDSNDCYHDLNGFEEICWKIARDRKLLLSGAAGIDVKYTNVGGIGNATLFSRYGFKLRFNVFYEGQEETCIHSHMANFMSFLVQGRYRATYWNVPNRLTQELSSLLSYEQVYRGLQSLRLVISGGDSEGSIESIFDAIDTDGSGTIGTKELIMYFKTHYGLTQEKMISRVVDEYDTNRDGQLSREEFLELARSNSLHLSL